MAGRKKASQSIIDSVLREVVDTKISDISPETVEKGKQYVDRFLSVYGDVPMVELVSGLWEKRKKSNLIKWLMMQANLNMDRLAEYFGCSKQYLNNKFNRDSFSFEDVVVTAYACNFTLALLANDGSSKRRVDAESIFDQDPDTWRRISSLKAESTNSKRAEYEQKKAELERMKQEYGFDD